MKLDMEMEIKHKRSRLTENQNHIKFTHLSHGKKYLAIITGIKYTEKNNMGTRDYKKLKKLINTMRNFSNHRKK